jgi:hypothetical protein
MKAKLIFGRTLLSLAIVTLKFAPVLAQQTTANIVGTVQDTQGAVVQGAAVKAANIATGLVSEVKANEVGQYRLDFLPIGTYTLEISGPGFKNFVQNDVVLTINQTRTVDATLAMGTASETVTVNEAPPDINTSTSEISRTIESREIITLPLVNRSVYSQLNLVPGVQSTSANTATGFQAQFTVINGGTGVDVSYYLNGALNMTMIRLTGNTPPNPDALQEFRVETSNYNAQFGRFAAGVVSVVTKSGTNALHGSAFEFLRNTNLNATPYLAPFNPSYHRNQFGFTLGGPIHKDRTFFFTSYSGLRQKTSVQLSGAVLPTTEEMAGNFHDSAVQPLDPTTGKPFNYNGISGNIDPSRIDPVAKAIASKYIPSATNLMSGYIINGLYGAFVPSPYDSNEWLGKFDHQINPSQRLSATYFWTKGYNDTVASGNIPNYSNIEYAWTQQNIILSHQWTIKPTLVNQAWFTYMRNFGARNFLDNGVSLTTLGSSFVPQGTPALPWIQLNGAFTLGQNFSSPIGGTDLYSIRDVLSKNIGRHAISAGIDFSLERDIFTSNLLNMGMFIFDGSKTRAAANNPFGYSPTVYKGNSLADFFLGTPVTMQQENPAPERSNSWIWAGFVQDDYRVRPNLTVNLGLRYDFQTPFTDPNNQELAFSLGVQSKVVPSAPAGVLFPGDTGVTRGTIANRPYHISPRVGFAFDPFGTGKTSVRAAAGLFFGAISAQEWENMTSGQPYILNEIFTNPGTLTKPYSTLPGGKSPFPYFFNPSNPAWVFPANVLTTALNFVWPYSYQLNASVQQQLPGGVTTQIAYIGELHRHLESQRDVNYPVYTPGVTTATVNNRRPYDVGLLSSVSQLFSDQNASFHSLQVSVSRRLARGLTFNAFYTWSHSIIDTPIVGANGSPVQDSNAPREDRGRSDYDQRSVFNASAIWDVNYYHGQNRFLGTALNGWQISPIIYLQSGLPLTILAGIDANADGVSNDRANLTGQSPVLSPHRGEFVVQNAWFNTAAFCNYSPTPTSGGPCLGLGKYGQDGSSPRDFIDAPGYKNVDLGLFRTISLPRELALQLRAEATNVFNIVNLGTPNTTLTSSAFGKISSAQTMRQIQLGVRLTF